jgi:hypothetical protein
MFSHAPVIWQAFPELAAGGAHLSGVHTRVSADAALARHVERASSHLHSGSESDLPPIQAWRRAFARMGLKPTQYRCASEALLRRLRKEGSLPRLHPLVDLCNAVSAAYAIPIAVFDLAHVAGALEVRSAEGDEDCLAFGGQHEQPEAGEVVFCRYTAPDTRPAVVQSAERLVGNPARDGRGADRCRSDARHRCARRARPDRHPGGGSRRVVGFACATHDADQRCAAVRLGR